MFAQECALAECVSGKLNRLVPRVMSCLSPSPITGSGNTDAERAAFMRDMLRDLGVMAQERGHDFLAYLIGMAQMEAARLALRG